MKTTLVATMLQPRMRPDEGLVGFNHGSFRDRLTVSGGKEFGFSTSFTSIFYLSHISLSPSP